jgi:hypothetical protein
MPMNLEEIIHKARNKLSSHGIDVDAPALVKEVKFNGEDWGARYKPVTDTILINTAIKRSNENESLKKQFQHDIEHELIHKWQFDLSKENERHHQLIRMLESHYSEAKQFLSEAGFPIPQKLWQIDDIEKIELILTFIKYRGELPDFESSISQRLKEIEKESEEIYQKIEENNLDIDDPNDQKAKKLHQELKKLQKEKNRIKSNPQKARKEFIKQKINSKKDKEIKRTISNLEKRFEKRKRLIGLISNLGEAMSYYWTYYRKGLLDQPYSEFLTLVKERFSNDNNIGDEAFEEFRNIYDTRCQAIKEGKSREKAFRKGLEEAKEKIRKRR